MVEIIGAKVYLICALSVPSQPPTDAQSVVSIFAFVSNKEQRHTTLTHRDINKQKKKQVFKKDNYGFVDYLMLLPPYSS